MKKSELKALIREVYSELHTPKPASPAGPLNDFVGKLQHVVNNGSWTIDQANAYIDKKIKNEQDRAYVFYRIKKFGINL
jgi:hypothetical protein